MNKDAMEHQPHPGPSRPKWWPEERRCLDAKLIDEDAMTGQEKVDRMDLKSYDWAMPQGWFDAALERTSINPAGHVVWSYDGDKNMFGLPVGIDAIGKNIVSKMAL